MCLGVAIGGERESGRGGEGPARAGLQNAVGVCKIALLARDCVCENQIKAVRQQLGTAQPFIMLQAYVMNAYWWLGCSIAILDCCIYLCAADVSSYGIFLQ